MSLSTKMPTAAEMHPQTCNDTPDWEGIPLSNHQLYRYSNLGHFNFWAPGERKEARNLGSIRVWGSLNGWNLGGRCWKRIMQRRGPQKSKWRTPWVYDTGLAVNAQGETTLGLPDSSSYWGESRIEILEVQQCQGNLGVPDLSEWKDFINILLTISLPSSWDKRKAVPRNKNHTLE